MPQAQSLHYEDSQYCSNLGSGALKHGFEIDIFSQFKDFVSAKAKKQNFHIKTRTQAMHHRLDKHIFLFSLPPSTQMHLKMVSIKPSPPFYNMTLKLRPHSRLKLESKDNLLCYGCWGATEDSKVAHVHQVAMPWHDTGQLSPGTDLRSLILFRESLTKLSSGFPTQARTVQSLCMLLLNTTCKPGI